MKKIFLIGLLGLIGLTSNVLAQMTLTSDTIALGDQTIVSGHFEQLWGDNIVIVNQCFDSAEGQQKAVITCFEPGEHWIHYSPTDSMPLTVTDVEVDTTCTEIRDIAPIVLIPHTFWEIFRWILLSLGIIGLVVLGWWLWKKWKSGKVTEWLSNEKPDTRTPEERALDNLEALRRRQLWQAGKHKEYHTELTDIVRRFIEESMGIRATEMTSVETVEAVRNGKWKVETSLLSSIFTTADMVKFAKSEPLPHEHDRSMSEAIEFVKMLWEQVKPTPTESGDQGKEATDA